jgi:xanthine dehydrogenase large subunit
MLAFSVREALRSAAAAFGPPGRSLELGAPATPEAVYWAIEQARRGFDADSLGTQGGSPAFADSVGAVAGNGRSSGAELVNGRSSARQPGNGRAGGAEPGNPTDAGVFGHG